MNCSITSPVNPSTPSHFLSIQHCTTSDNQIGWKICVLCWRKSAHKADKLPVQLVLQAVAFTWHASMEFQWKIKKWKAKAEHIYTFHMPSLCSTRDNKIHNFTCDVPWEEIHVLVTVIYSSAISCEPPDSPVHHLHSTPDIRAAPQLSFKNFYCVRLLLLTLFL